MSSSEERLARAAAALAAAEGVTGVRGRDDAGVHATEGPAHPPEDPRSRTAEADPYAVARAIVLRQLALAPRSRAQLAKKLHDRGCPEEVAQEVLDRMGEVGLVDDEAYAEMLVRSKQSTKGLARRGLAHELQKQGIDREIADDALARVAPEDEREKAEQLVAKKLRTLHGLSPDVQARRLAGMLARKGYPGEVAWPVIREAIERAAEHQRD